LNLEGLTDEQLQEALESGVLPSPSDSPLNPTTDAVNPSSPLLVNQHDQYHKEHEPIPEPQPELIEGFDFKDPVELLMVLDDKIVNGDDKLHDWQVQFMEDFALSWTKEKPFRALMRAANSSGKDKYIIAACVVWLSMKYSKALCVVTSSSGQQLDHQTCKHISSLCHSANAKIHPNVFKINYRHYVCLATGSPIDCFATDEPGKAEGWHPLESKRKLALFMSEAKTVTDDINTAYDRCHGYTHRVHVSSPGPPRRHFYEDHTRAISRNKVPSLVDYHIKTWVEYVVTAYMCPHIDSNEIEYMRTKYGEKDPIFLSSMLAEFSTEGEQVVIPFHTILECKNSKPLWVPEGFNKAGLDLADGGDETVLIVRNGNKMIALEPFKLNKSYLTRLYLDELFKKYALNHPNSFIYADCGGIGKPILDELVLMGWTNIRYIDNRHAARDKRVYYKLATEMWFNLKKPIEQNEIIIMEDKKLTEQLSSRYYKIRTDGTKHLLSKPEQKAKGYPSPDRADSFVLAFADYKVQWKMPEEEKSAGNVPFAQQPPAPIVGEFTINEHAKRKNITGYAMTSNYRPSPIEFDVYKDDLRRHNELILSQTSSK
jgi:hypothetical protein